MNYVIPSYRFGVSSAALAAAGVVAADVGGAALITGEGTGMGIDFTYHTDPTKQVEIRGTGAYSGTAQGKLTYTAPSVKLCRQSDGVWRYVNHNLCIQSQTLDNASWSKFGITLTANDTNAPDDTATADKLEATSADSSCIMSFTAVVGVAYTISVWLKANGATTISIHFGSPLTATVCNVTTSWQRFTVSAIADNTSGSFIIGGASTFTTGEIVYAWGAQIKRTPVNDAAGYTYATGYLATTSAAAYDLPFEWDISGNSLGILVEEQRANLTTQSQTLTHADWVMDNGARTADAVTAPDGTLTADRYHTGAGGFALYRMYNDVSLTNGQAHTWSVFAKAGEVPWIFIDCHDGASHYTYFNVATGVVGTTAAGNTATITDAGNGWWRCTSTRTAGSGSGYNIVGLTDLDNGDPPDWGTSAPGNIGAYFWGAQIELGAFPTSPIHTVAASVTRVPDNISLATSSYPHSATVGTAIVNATKVGALDASVSCLTINDDTDNERFQFFSSNGSGNGSTRFFVADGGASQFPTNPIDANVIVLGTPFKMGAAWAANDLAAAHDSGTVATSGTATLPTVTTMRFANAVAGSQGTSHYIRQVTYLPRRATNLELQTLTNDIGASVLLLGELDGLAFDFTYATTSKQARIKDGTTPANMYSGTPQAKLTYTSPSAKLTRQSDGVWRYNNHNLVLRSQELDNASWNKQQATISANVTTAPDGTSTADKLEETAVSNVHRAYIAFTAPAGVECQWSIYAKAAERSWMVLNCYDSISGDLRVWFQLAGSGTVGSSPDAGIIAPSITSVGNGWYRVTARRVLSATATGGLLLPEVTTGDNAGGYLGVVGSGAYFWGAQVKRYPVQEGAGLLSYLATTTAAVYDLPYEWSAAGVPQGILIEEARTNLLTRSQTFASPWANNGATPTVNATTSPDGTSTGAKLVESAANGQHTTYHSFTGTVAAYTCSVFMKAADRSFGQITIQDAGTDHGVTVNLSSGTIGSSIGTPTSSSISDAGNGWYRVTVTKTMSAATCYVQIGTATADGSTLASYVGDGVKGIYVWDAQVELGAFPTSPIHTIAGTVARAVDQVTLAMSSLPWTKTNGTFIFWGDTAASSGTQGEVATAVAGGAFSVSMNTDLFNIVPTTGNSFNNIFPTPPAANTLFKDGCAWASNDGAFVRNAGAATTDSTLDVGGTDATSLSIGRTSANYLNGHIRQVTYLKRRATNVELQTKTS